MPDSLQATNPCPTGLVLQSERRGWTVAIPLGEPSCHHPTVPFTRMDRSTAADWRVVSAETRRDAALVPDRILALLGSLREIWDGHAVDQLTHCLQTATRAERASAEEEVVLAALLHDAARPLSETAHPEMAAAMLQPYVRPAVVWVVRRHQDFTSRYWAPYLGGNPSRRRRHRLHPAYRLACRFADDWDQASFDPGYDTLPLEHFEPLVRRLMARPRYGGQRTTVRRLLSAARHPLRSTIRRTRDGRQGHKNTTP